jgi:hypothetical protein
MRKEPLAGAEGEIYRTVLKYPYTTNQHYGIKTGFQYPVAC